MSRIFISYKRIDKDKVFKIKDQIESAIGEKCWIDLDGIESDAQFMNVIIKAIRECEVLLFMYSKVHAQITDFEKDWTIRELNFASKKEKRIVFVNIDGSPLSDEFEFMYGTKQQVDAISTDAMIKLCTDIRTWLSIPTLEQSYNKHKTKKAVVTSINKRMIPDKEQIFKVDNVKFKMIRVDGGTFTMGATPEMEDPDDDEKPAHEVTLSTYYIGETQVTQALWKAIMGNNPSNFIGDDMPVENVTWEDCQVFITKLNKGTGQKFRLLTEAEWEFAARGGNKSMRYQYAGSNNIDEVAWFDKNSYDKDTNSATLVFGTNAVKQKNPNELNVYDMSGNVCEWCQDWYDEYIQTKQTNPIGPKTGCLRVVRGGSWYHEAWENRISCRNYDSQDRCDGYIGFRLALSE